MRVFELYARRIMKRKLTLVLIIVLPVLFTYSVVAQYDSATKLTVTTYVEDAALDHYLTAMLEKQEVTVTRAETEDDAIHYDGDVGLVLTATVKDVLAKPDELAAAFYSEGGSLGVGSLQIKLNSILSVLQTLAHNSADEASFEANLAKSEQSAAPIQVKQSIIGNPNAVVLTSAFNMIVFIMLFLTMTNTMLFLGDKIHMTTQRVLLSTYSRLSYYLQTVGVFAAIGIAQFLLMILLMSTVFQIDLSLSIGQLLLLVAAYGLLNVIAAGIGLLLVSRTTRLSTGRLLISVVSLPLAMLGGTLWDASIMPEGMQKLSRLLPTGWITQLNREVFSGTGSYSQAVVVHMACLAACAAVLFLLLSRVKTENI
ncbi:permease [Paenibacillus sp. CCS19]|uniref:ABC transporter permease n=1 Tax=Paenibacillus sp. CCS19 TaxID=3158387 RepID=UPI002566C049|nr:ABC transporter permease [Paenibacillus cellulosilyticus]GMK38586.1 permease [Paenibacillus cellulosilyticus]